MAQSTQVLGLKKPEGTDPFLASDFAANWQKIDDAIGQLRAEGQGQINADTLGGIPASGFAPASGSPNYAAKAHSHSGDSTSSGLTQAQADARYAPITHLDNHGTSSGGGSYTLPADVVRAPGRVNPRTQFSVTNVEFNGTNGEELEIPHTEMNYVSVPTVLLTVQVGSNFDMVANVQGRTPQKFSVRVARVTGQTTGTTAVPYTNCFLHWLVISP